VKPFLIHVSVNGDIDLRVATSQTTAKRYPVSISAMAPAIHLDKAWPIISHHYLPMRWTVLETHGVKNTANVGDNDLAIFRLCVDRNASIIYKSGTIGRALVINPAHCCLVNSVARYMIHNVFLPSKEFLAKDGAMTAISTNALLRIHENIKVLFGLLKTMTQLDTIRTGRLNRFDHNGKRFGSKELLDVRKVRPPRLSY